jgi:uncharacterized protein
MTVLQGAALFVAAILGSTLNAVAGGGSFITFPTLVFAGVPAVRANATSTVALWPGGLASVGAYRDTFTTERRDLIILGLTSAVGGVVGAILLLHTSSPTFLKLVPFLLLGATLLFAFGGRLTANWLNASEPMAKRSQRSMLAIVALQFVIAVYGGFFGGGIGILMLATLSFMGMTNIHAMNGLKALLATCINGVAVVTFVVASAVDWPAAIIMIVGGIVGGYGGAAAARRVDQAVVRRIVIVVGLGMAIYFFTTQYLTV